MRRRMTGFLATALMVCACGPGIVARATGTVSTASGSWSLQPTPQPNGASLLSVSCTSAAACTATGNRATGVTVAEAWNGTAWSIRPTPKIPGGTDAFLRGVSCTSAASCIAVGDYLAGTKDATLAERWNGTAWAIAPIPNPPGAQGSFLYGVSCAAPRSCTAVGDFIGRTGAEKPLAERWNGSAWSIQPVPSPPAHQQGVLMGVSCTTASACTAVGLAPAPPGGSRTLAEAWNGSAWSIKQTPDVPGAKLNTLAAVSCMAAACMAVGNDSVSAGSTVTLAEAWNGSAWSIEPTPHLGGAASSFLAGVSCTSATVCTASGHYVNGSQTGLTLAEGWNGSRWAVQRTLRPAGTVDSFLNGVSCTSAVDCTAAGNYVNTTPSQGALVERHSAR
jgi:hypothetical protein